MEIMRNSGHFVFFPFSKPDMLKQILSALIEIWLECFKIEFFCSRVGPYHRTVAVLEDVQKLHLMQL